MAGPAKPGPKLWFKKVYNQVYKLSCVIQVCKKKHAFSIYSINIIEKNPIKKACKNQKTRANFIA
jgi:hypothetical protein